MRVVLCTIIAVIYHDVFIISQLIVVTKDQTWRVFLLSIDVPQWLHNRNKCFVCHCMKHLPIVSGITRDQIVELPNGLFHMFTGHTGRHYDVRLDENSHSIHSSACLLLHRLVSKIKHMLAIICLMNGYSWNSFAEEYRLCV